MDINQFLAKRKIRNARIGEANRVSGISFEFEILASLKKEKGVAIRSAGSHSIVDLVQIKKDKILLINCKSNGVWTGKELKDLEKLKQQVPSNCIVMKARKSGKGFKMEQV